MDLIIGFFEIIAICVLIMLVAQFKSTHKSKSNICSFCGKYHADTYKLKDGKICWECLKVPYSGYRLNFVKEMDRLRTRSISVDDMKRQFAFITAQGQYAKDFKPTRISPRKIIEVDDNLKMFRINDAAASHVEVPYLHRISDIKSFKLEFEKSKYNGDAPEYVNGGHIRINMNEVFTPAFESFGVELTLFMKHHVREEYEKELEFLEAVTGLHRG